MKATREQILAAANKTIPDVIAPNLKVLFCGINPGLYTAATGFHFARPGNKFWKALFLSGFTPKLFDPSEQQKLLGLGFGITNMAARSSAAAADLNKEELRRGAKALTKKVKKYKPKVLAILGVSIYRLAFDKPGAKLGLQEGTIGVTKIWLLPNPSGLNANYSLEDFVSLFKQLKIFLN